MTSIDLTPLLEALLGLAATAVSTAVPILVIAALRWLHVAVDANLSHKMDVATNAGAGVAYQYGRIKIEEGGLSNVHVHSQALANGLNYVLTTMPETIETLGLTKDAVAGMVRARLGTLLASDPTVTASAPTEPAPQATTKVSRTWP